MSESEAARERAESMDIDGSSPMPSARQRAIFAQRSRLLYPLAVALMSLAVIYGLDLINSVDRVPRGTEVAGVSVGGMQYLAAEEKLQTELGPRLDEPVDIRAGAVSTTLDPAEVGLSVDWPATLERAGSQPLNPFTRFFSLFFGREVGIASIIPDERLTSYLERLALSADFGPREGAIWFDSDQVRSITPMDGQRLLIEPSRDAVLTSWLDEGGVDLVVEYDPTETDAENVRALVRDVARPAVDKATRIIGSLQTAEGEDPPMTTMSLAPAEAGGQAREIEIVDPRAPEAVEVEFPRDRIGEYLSFEREGDQLVPRYDAEAARGLLEPELAETETVGRDASFRFSGDSASVVPAVQGRTVNWGPLLDALPAELSDTTGPRLVPVVYEKQDPDLSTEEAERAGIRTPVGESRIPIPASSYARQMLNAVDGYYIPPGGRLSLATTAGTQSGDVGADAVATALFNAGYEAGAQSMVRTSRGVESDAFPLARDATASGDVAFTNPQGTGMVVQALVSDGAVGVRLWGTREYRVDSTPASRSDTRQPEVSVETGPDCRPSSGEPGFTATVTRTVNRGDDTVSTDRFQSVYAPIDRIECRAAPPPPPGDDDGDDGDDAPSPPPASPGGPGGPPTINIPGIPPITLPGN